MRRHPSSVLRRLLLAVLLVLSVGCGEERSGFATPEPPPPPVDAASLCTQEGATRCDDNRFQTCIEGEWSAGIRCETPTPLCHAQDGCGLCPAGTRFCQGRDVYQCSDDGTVAALESTCGDTEACLAGDCYDACATAESQLSYLGCSFLAAPTANILDPVFDDDFAVVIGNPHEIATEVVVRHQGMTLDVVDVPPEDTVAIPLDYVPSLQTSAANTLAEDGAYELRTSLPVAAYQYNPLHFRSPSDNQTFSYTNDASLLMPEHVLTGEYIVSAWPSLGIGDAPATQFDWLPGYVAVVGTTNGTQVTFTSAAETMGGEIGPLMVGDEETITLNRGDVLQVFSHQPTEPLANACTTLGGIGQQVGSSELCLSVNRGDLTNSRISATEPVAVFAGHVCSFVPFYEWACDHLEEAMMPLATWGATVAVTAPTAPGGTVRARTQVRIISATDENLLRFDPPVQPDQFLDSGGVLEFISNEHFTIEAAAPILVTQFMFGQQALETASGDPSMGTAVPTTQWRAEYDFLAPDTYTSNHINVVAPRGAQIYLDSQLIQDWEDVGDSAYATARVQIESGAHRIESVDDVAFGLTSYGYASFTSYLHPGGLNLLR